MIIRCGVKDKVIEIQCGDGSQQLKWLANVACCRYDSTNGIELGPPLGLRLEDGTKISMKDVIRDKLKDDAQIFVVLRDDDE
eukprot:CAMPEP_0175121018 /NCGR_PEP_ID=MMETSP0087-20121206/936_1 /TAXON_ID=136419 /ORGANISM="Unknown Unknown, Strain D1" /LENGTH=81 /DNA_ID=CAMNT_0016402515 /DNA_START=8 /DNA_END=253 /DNA_ORIENTATION=+